MKFNSELFTSGGILICAVMILFNLAQLKKRGTGALIRAIAFAVLGLSFVEFKFNFPFPIQIFTGFVVIVLLGIDVIIKACKAQGKSK